jgi:putative endonuclease
VTSNLINRGSQHKEKADSNSFTARYNVNKIVYYEVYGDVSDALEREKQIKAGSREDKLKFIRGLNPGWKDLLAEV